MNTIIILGLLVVLVVVFFGLYITIKVNDQIKFGVGVQPDDESVSPEELKRKALLEGWPDPKVEQSPVPVTYIDLSKPDERAFLPDWAKAPKEEAKKSCLRVDEPATLVKRPDGKVKKAIFKARSGRPLKARILHFDANNLAVLQRKNGPAFRRPVANYNVLLSSN